MESELWDTAAVVTDTLSAHAVLGRLTSEGVPARLLTDTALLGVVRQCRILVPRRLLRRARCVLWLSQFSDEELATLALSTSAESVAGGAQG
jgi:hypothetical protein